MLYNDGIGESIKEPCLRCLLHCSEATPTALHDFMQFAVNENSALSIICRMLDSCNMLVVGNACLFLSKIAQCSEYVELLDQSIPLLIAVLKRDFQKVGTTNPDLVRKNAAVCLARLSKHSPHLTQIRDLRGIEIMLNYAKKII